MSNVDWILITLVRAISRVRANNATLPFLLFNPPLLPAKLFALVLPARQKRNIIREGGNFGRKKSERGKKKKKSDLSRFSLHLAIELRITTNKSDKSWLDVIKHWCILELILIRFNYISMRRYILWINYWIWCFGLI